MSYEERIEHAPATTGRQVLTRAVLPHRQWWRSPTEHGLTESGRNTLPARVLRETAPFGGQNEFEAHHSVVLRTASISQAICRNRRVVDKRAVSRSSSSVGGRNGRRGGSIVS